MRTLLALLVTGAASAALAAPPFEFHGYFRDPLAFNSRGGGQVCFQLPGSEFKARLGNECDHYWELTFDATVFQDASGLEAKVEFMPAYGLLVTAPTGREGSGYGTGSVYTQQMWASLKVPQLGGALFWAGQRYYRRKNVESADWFYWNPYQGQTAAGVEEVKVGRFGKLAVNVGRTEAIGSFAEPADVVQGTYIHPSARLYEIPVNRDGKLEAGVDVLVAVHQGGALGPDPARVSPWFTIEHEQQKLWGGGFNRISFQWASGAAATMSPAPLSGASSHPRQWRVIEQLIFEPVPEVSGQLFLAYMDQDDFLGGVEARGSGARIYTAELRPAYHFNDWFKFQVDAFWQQLDVKGESGSNPQLVKLTLAPTLVAGRGFLARPELRLFATWGFWNDAAARLGDALGQPLASGAFRDATHGLVVGAHVEGWW